MKTVYALYSSTLSAAGVLESIFYYKADTYYIELGFITNFKNETRNTNVTSLIRYEHITFDSQLKEGIICPAKRYIISIH